MRRILLAGVALMLAACGDDPTAAPPAPTVAGTYDLTTMDGRALPLTVIEVGAYQAQLLSGTLALRSDGTYAFDLGLRLDVTGNPRAETRSDVGRWHATDKKITLTSSQDVLARTGVLSGNAITLQSGGAVFVLTRSRR